MGGKVFGQVANGDVLPIQVDADGKIYVTGALLAVTHNLLDATIHPDTVAQTVSRGSIIRGDSTPKWNELTLGAAGTILSSDGNDVLYRTMNALFNAGLAGAAFPASPTAGDVFFRTDLGLFAYYDGTRWLSQNEYTIERFAFTATADGSNVIGVIYPDSIYVTRGVFNYKVATTNDGSNYWTLAMRSYNTARSAYDTLYSVNTSADAADTWLEVNGVTTAVPTNNSVVLYVLTKTLSPGTLTIIPKLYYRKILT